MDRASERHEQDLRHLATESQQHRQLLQAVIDQTQGAVIILDGSTLRVKWINQPAREMLASEFQQQDPVGRPVEDVWPQTWVEGWADIVHQVAQTGQSHFEPEMIYSSPTRGATYWRWTLTRLDTPGEQAPDLLSVLADITDEVVARKNVQQRAADLQRTVQTLETVIETIPAGVVVCDESGAVTLTNSAGKAITGGEIRGDGRSEDNVFTLFDRSGRRLAPEELPLARALKGQVHKHFEMILRQPGRPDKVVSTNNAPILDPQGRIIGAVTSFEDVTDRNRAQEALRRSEARLSAMFVDSPVALVIFDEQLHYTRLNAMAGRMFGRPIGQIMGRAMGEIAPALAGYLRPIFQQILETGEPRINFEVTGKLQEGQTRTWLASCFPLATPEGRRGLGVIAEDITAQKLAQEAADRHAKQLALLSRTSQEINRVLEIPAIMRTLVAAAIELIGAQSGTAGLLENGRFVFHEYNRQGQIEPWEFAFEPGLGVPGRVLQTQQPYIANDVLATPDVLLPLRERLGFCNLIDVPIISRTGQLLGCFEIHNKTQGQFDESDLVMLQGLAASASVAMENARMLEQRQIVENQLRGQGVLLRQFIERSPAALAMFDRQMRYLAASERWMTDYRLGQADIIGKSHYEVFPDIPERWREIHRRCLAGEVDQCEEDPFPRNDGSLDWVKWEVRPWYEPSDEIGGIIMFTEVITQRKNAQLERERLLRRLEVYSRLLKLARDRLERRVAARTLELARTNESLRDEIQRRMENERALRQSESFNRATLDALSANICIVDAKGTILAVNQAWRGFGNHNGAPSDFVGTNYLDVCDQARGPFSEGASSAAVGIRAVVAGSRERFEMEYPCPGPNEPEAYFCMRVTRFVGPGAVRVAIAHEDITGQRRAQVALQESEQRFRQMAEALPEVFWIADGRQHKLLYVNGAFERIWGRSRHRLFEDPESRLESVHPQDRQRVQGEMHRWGVLLATGSNSPLEIDYRIVRPDGRSLTIHSRTFPIRDAQGRLVRLCGIAEDITLERAAESAVRQLAAIVDSASDAILSVDTAGLITTWNPGAETLFGYARGEAIGKHVDILIPPDRQEEMARLVGSTRKQAIGPLETVRLRKDGSRVPVQLTMCPIRDLTGKLAGFSAIVRDMTERNLLERKAMEIGEQERRRIGQDLHDTLGQDLTAIAFLTKVLEQRLAARKLSEAASAADLVALTNTAIGLTRSLAHGLTPIGSKPESLMEGLHELAQHVSDVYRIVCRLRCPKPVLVSNNTVATHLYRIVQEAINNAIKHGKARRIVVSLRETQTAIRLAVRDNGSGLPPSHNKGPGMGLRIMRHRAHTVGATLEVAPRKVRGTIIKCLLPKERSETA